MPDPATQADRRDARVQRIAREAVRHARGQDGWAAYEGAKRYVRRTYGAHVPGYDAITQAITDRLGL